MARRQWVLMVFDVPPGLAGLMVRLKLNQARTKPTTFVRMFPGRQKAAVLRTIDALLAAGLHGRARLVERQPGPPRPRRPALYGAGTHAAGTPVTVLRRGAAGRRNYDQVHKSDDDRGS